MARRSKGEAVLGINATTGVDTDFKKGDMVWKDPPKYGTSDHPKTGSEIGYIRVEDIPDTHFPNPEEALIRKQEALDDEGDINQGDKKVSSLHKRSDSSSRSFKKNPRLRKRIRPSPKEGVKQEVSGVVDIPKATPSEYRGVVPTVLPDSMHIEERDAALRASLKSDIKDNVFSAAPEKSLTYPDIPPSEQESTGDVLSEESEDLKSDEAGYAVGEEYEGDEFAKKPKVMGLRRGLVEQDIWYGNRRGANSFHTGFQKRRERGGWKAEMRRLAGDIGIFFNTLMRGSKKEDQDPESHSSE